MPTPYEKAAALYPDDESFQSDLLPHLVKGWVISTPTLFVMARPVLSKAPAALIARPWVQFDEPDAWFIWLMAGSPEELFKAMPYPLPLMGVARFGQPARFWPLERAKEIACKWSR